MLANYNTFCSIAVQAYILCTSSSMVKIYTVCTYMVQCRGSSTGNLLSILRIGIAVRYHTHDI